MFEFPRRDKPVVPTSTRTAFRPVRVPLLDEEQLRSLARYPDPWSLQFEYARFRREVGLDPASERLNRWLAAWDELGDRDSGRLHDPPRRVDGVR